MGRRFKFEEKPDLVQRVRKKLQGKAGTVTLDELYELMDRAVDKETIRVWIRRGYIDAGKSSGRHGQYIRKERYSRRPYKIEIKSVLEFLEKFNDEN